MAQIFSALSACSAVKSRILKRYMSRGSPIAAGIRIASRRPALVATEIAWRWALGAAVWALVIFTFFTYLGSLTVSRADWLMLRTGVPVLVAQAVQNIFGGSGPRLLRAAAVLLPGISVLWIFAASFGRWATLRALISESRGRYRTVLGLHFLRAALALAAWIGYLGALLAAGVAATRGPEERSGLFLLIFFALALVIAFFHWRVRWYVFLANIIAVRDGRGAFSAISEALALYGRRRGPFWTLGLTMSAIRLFLLIAVTVVSLAPMAVIPSTAWVALVVVLGVITLAYFVVADFLFTARLAAYVEILRDDIGPEPPVAVPLAPPQSPEPLLPTTPEPGPGTELPMADGRGPTTSALEPSS